jgi:hypothetical protein
MHHYFVNEGNMIEKVKVKDVIGENCITLDDGQKIYDIIEPLLTAEQEVELDFSDVRIFASPFMNAAIGQLLLGIDTAQLDRLLIVDRNKITPVGLAVMGRVIQNAKEYYSDESIRQAVDEVLDSESQGN